MAPHNNPWRYLHAARGEPNVVQNFQQLARAWETRALAAEASVRDLRRENTMLREELDSQREEIVEIDRLSANS